MIDSISGEDLTLYMDIVNRKNDVSDLVMAYLNFQFDSAYVFTPEQWQEESSRPMMNSESIKSTRKYNQKSTLETKAYPNPVRDELIVYFDSKEHNFLNIELINALGNIVLEETNLKKQEVRKLNIEYINPGVYYLKFNNGIHCIEYKKIIVIH